MLTRQSASLSVTALRRASLASSGGSSSSCGIVAPPTSTGMTTGSPLSAVPTSRRTKSLGSSSRRSPSRFFAFSQPRPTTTSSASAAPTAELMRSTKSTPGSSVSTSMKTRSEPNSSESAS